MAFHESAERKERSEAVLTQAGVPINPNLPAIESEAEARIRTKDEAARRAMALLAVAVKGEGLGQQGVEGVLDNYGLRPYLTPAEKRFIEDPRPSEHDRIQFTWRYEAAWTLLWALSFIEELPPPISICDVPLAASLMAERTAEQFVSDAKLRPASEILDQADLIYRYHWAVVEERLGRIPLPSGLEPGVVQERHHALNWLIGYMGQEWDKVTTDT